MTATHTSTRTAAARRPIGTAVWPSSSLDAVDVSFTALTTGPAPLSLDCDALTEAHHQAHPDIPPAALGLPAGEVNLADLRTWLLSEADGPADLDARDIVWREVILRARTGSPRWVVAVTGLALPGLIGAARDLISGFDGNPDDLDSEVLTGFLEALRGKLDVDKSAPYASLIAAGKRAGYAARAEDYTYVPVPDMGTVPSSRSPEVPWEHTDILLGRAVDLGLLDTTDADAWAEVRLCYRPEELIADHQGVSVNTLRKRLERADGVLKKALQQGLLSTIVSAGTVIELARKAKIRDNKRAAQPAARPTERLALIAA